MLENIWSFFSIHKAALVIAFGWFVREVHNAVKMIPMAWNWIGDNGGLVGFKNYILRGKSKLT